MIYLSEIILKLPKLSDFWVLVPELTLGALITLGLILEVGGRREDEQPPVVPLSALGLIGLLGWLFFAAVPSGQTAFAGMVIDDGLGRAVCLIVVLALLLVLPSGSAELAREKSQFPGEFYLLLLSAGLGMILMGKATSLITIFLGLELFSLSLYLLCVFHFQKPNSQESGMKYFILSSAASATMLYGMALIYGAAGTTWVEEISTQMLAGTGLLFEAGSVLLLAGLAFKIAAIPFHSWVPDVYEGAPTSVTAFMSVATKAAALTVFVRLFALAFHDVGGAWPPLVFGMAILSMVLGNAMAVPQDRVKRMLAYSSIAHAGYLFIVPLLGLNGVRPMFFYLLAYALMNIGAFSAILCLEQATEGEVTLDTCRGLASRNPLWAWSFAICLISLTGLPPTAGFLGKFYLFGAAVKADLLFLAAFGVLGSVISAYYYLGVLIEIFAEPDEQSPRPLEMPSGPMAGLGAGALGVLLLGLFPTPVMEWLDLLFKLPG